MDRFRRHRWSLGGVRRRLHRRLRRKKIKKKESMDEKFLLGEEERGIESKKNYVGVDDSAQFLHQSLEAGSKTVMTRERGRGRTTNVFSPYIYRAIFLCAYDLRTEKAI